MDSYKVLIHKGTICDNTIIDPKGVKFSNEVPVIMGGDRRIVGKATGIYHDDGCIRGTIIANDAVGLSPAISGRILEYHEVDGIRVVDKFELLCVGLVSPDQTDTEPLA